MKKFVTVLLICIITVVSGFARESEAAQEQADEQEVDTRLIPVFPEEPKGLIFVEGEEAVSTNFAKEPVYNYGCSNLRTLQLSRSTGLQGGSPFYARYVLYVEEPGVYSFGYGGTPPGPADDLYPSYVSPFRYSIDEGPEKAVYREDVAVISGYTPAYYWVHLGEVELSEGIHTVTFSVSERRRFDNTYFFYLDNFFFLKKDRIDSFLRDPGKRVFPTDYNDRSIDNPFLSIADYMSIIQSSPEDPKPYIEISLVYSLIGDYLNALKMLNRAIVLDPEDPYPQLLSAKNKIWKGDIADGIETYRRVLELEPDNPQLWAEAAKVAAWTNLYKEALDIYHSALERFPDNISLTVNLALTYLWMSRNEEADAYLKRAREIAGTDPQAYAELGRVFIQNEYYEKAVEVYEAAVEAYPEYLELYLLLETAYEKLGMEDEAGNVYDRISETFQPSAELAAYLELFRKKKGLEQEIIDDYRTMITRQPDNLELRRFLMQTYFWNGMREEAVQEMLNILSAHAYNNFKRLDERSMGLYHVIDTCLVYNDWFGGMKAEADRLHDALEEQLATYRTALKAAVKESESDDETTGTAARDLFRAEEEKLNALFAGINGFAGSYSENVDDFLETTELDQWIEKENEEKRAFKMLTEHIGWSWNRKFHLDELDSIRSREPVTAGYVLGRIHYFEGNYQAAGELYSTGALSESRLPPVVFARYQLSIRNPSDTEEKGTTGDRDILLEYAPYIEKLEDLIDRLSERTEGGYLYPDDSVLEAERFLTILDEIEDDVTVQQRHIRGKLATLNKITLGRMQRSFYQLEENTYLLRYELGDYYLTMGRPENAVEQFKMVLAIDPWNISATYKLGTVQQLSGNWSKAMDSYKKVYWSDPDYANTLRYHNQLARAHADSFSFRSTSFYDTTRIDYEGTAEYHRKVNSFIGWDMTYRYENDRLCRTFNGESPGAFSLHSLRLGIPLSLCFLNVTITPFGGVGIRNALYNVDPSFPPDTSYEPDIVLSEFYADLFYGLHGKLGIGPVEIFGGWSNQRKTDTYFPEREAVFANAGELQVSTYFSFPDMRHVNSFSTRSYGRFEFLTDANMTGTFVQELVGSFHLSDTPWVNLDITGVGSYEDSIVPETTDYYSPDADITAKGGVRGTVVLPVGGGSLGLSLWLSAGGYHTGTPEDGTSFYTDGYFDLNFYRGESTLTLSLYGSGTFTPGEFPLTDYWSFQGRLGFSTRMPDLLSE